MSKPEKVFKMGAVRASVFVNPIQRDGQIVPLRKVVLEVRYRDKAGQWQSTSSLSINDLPKAITALQQAYEFLLCERSPAESEPEMSPPAGSTDQFGPLKPIRVGTTGREPAGLSSPGPSKNWR